MSKINSVLIGNFLSCVMDGKRTIEESVGREIDLTEDMDDVLNEAWEKVLNKEDKEEKENENRKN